MGGKAAAHAFVGRRRRRGRRCLRPSVLARCGRRRPREHVVGRPGAKPSKKNYFGEKSFANATDTENGIRANLILTMAFQRSRFLRMAEMQFSKT
jgi:hypothetical protein